MKRYIKIICICVILLLNSVLVIEAKDSTINVDVSLHDIKNEKQYSTSDDISTVEKGTEVELVFDIELTGASIDAIQLTNLKGLTYIESMTWNDQLIDNEKNRSNNKWLVVNSQNNNRLIIKTTYDGSTKVEAVFSMKRTDDSTYTKKIEFIKNTKVSQSENKKIDINFYTPSGKLVYYEKIVKGETIEIPNYQIYGYEIVGYKAINSQDYYQNEPLQESTDFYAVITPLKFNVYYYVDNLLYKQEEKIYGSNFIAISPPQKTGYQFIEWVGLVDSIKGDVYLYALYEYQGEFYIEDKIIENLENSEQDLTDIEIKEMKQKLIQLRSQKLGNSKDHDEEALKVIRISENQTEFAVEQEEIIKKDTGTTPTQDNVLPKVMIGIGTLLLASSLIIIFRMKKSKKNLSCNSNR